LNHQASSSNLHLMIVTHTQNANGDTRLYIGGKGSLECWIEPRKDGRTWTFHLDEAVTGNHLSPDDRRQWAIHTLISLAQSLNVSPQDLASIPYEAICALHATDPFAGRRVAQSKRRTIEAGFMATRPDIRRPTTDFSSSNTDDQSRSKRR